MEVLGIITPTQCIRAERYVERHVELLRNAAHMTVSEPVEFALKSGT